MYVLREPQLSECLVDVVGRYSLLGFFLGNLVGFGGDEGDEFDAAVDEQVACVPGEGDAGGGEDFGYDFLDGC